METRAAVMSVMIARFDGVTDVSAGKAIKVTWPALVERLSMFEKAENKKAVGGWTPAIFRPFCECGEANCPGERGHRTNSNVLEVYALAFDLDKTSDGKPLDQAYADAALERLNELGLQYVVHTTHSHAPPTNVSLRVVVAISRPVSGHEWEHFWAAAVDYIDIHVEAACKNLGRFWFLPSARPDADPWARSTDGKPLDVDELMSRAASAPASTASDTRDWRREEGDFDEQAFLALVRKHDASAKECSSRSRLRFDIVCPWEHEHSSSSPRDTTVAFTSDGRPEFSCLHSHCHGRHWQEFRAHCDPDYAAFRANGFRPLQQKKRREQTQEQKDELRERRERKNRARIAAEHATGDETGHAGIGPYGGYRLTDLGNARRFADAQANRLRFVKNWNQWLVWDGRRWKKDETGVDQQAAKGVVAQLYLETSQVAARQANAANSGTLTQGAPIEDLAKWCKDSSKASRITAMIQLARSEPELATTSSIWDSDPWLLNVSNGTIDLRSGELHAHAQGDMLTMLAPVEYDPLAEAPQWEAFLSRVQPDEEVRAYLQRYLGYALTGDVREQCLAFFYGGGSNGKSVLLDVVLDIVGDYGLRAAPDLVLAKFGEAHPTELADLEGRRLVVCSEIEQGRTWAEALIKRITGDRTITARRMRQDFYTFPTTHKLIVAANTRPGVRGTDHGIWRRMRLVPWEVQIPNAEQDKTLPARLVQEEAPGILAWLVRGCIAWQNHELGSAKAIDEATRKYRDGEDVIGRWLEERCDFHGWMPQAEAYENFKTWCEAEGMDPWKRKTFKDRVLEREHISEAKRDNGSVRAFQGISIKRVGLS